MIIGTAVRLALFRRINIIQPVIGNNLACRVINQSCIAVGSVRIGIDPPILLKNVLLYRLLQLTSVSCAVARLRFRMNDLRVLT